MSTALKVALPRRFVLLSFVCLTASGAAGLIAEVVWSRVLAALFGSALTGTGLLLAIFMAGLGLGSMIGGRLLRRRFPPLVAFGVVELTIGALVFTTPALFRMAAPIAIRLESGLSDALAPLAPALTSIVILGPIVILMGMTFPLFLAGIAGEKESLGTDAGWVYGINTFGAVAGTIIAGFWLLPALGIRRSLFVAGTTDLLVGALCLVIGLRSRAAPAMREAQPGKPWNARLRSAFAITVLGGAAALILEVAWFRALMSIFGSSVYALSLMLAAFLLGISGGAIFGAPRIGGASSAAAVATFHTRIAFTATLITFLLQIIPLGYIALLQRFGSSFSIVSAGTSLLLFLTLVIPTALMGMALPAAIAWGSSDEPDEDAVSQAGRIYAGSSLGSAAGAIAAGFLLVPWWGVRGAVVTAALLSIGAAFVALRGSADAPARRNASRLAVATAVVWIVWLGGLLPWDWRVLTGGHYAYAHLYSGQTEPAAGPTKRQVRLTTPLPFVDGAVATPPERPMVGGHRLLSWRDGRFAQVAVSEEGGIRTLLLNGKADASNALADMRTQLLLGHLPVLLAPDEPSGQAMIIGLGSGVTAGAVAAWPFQSIVAAEIEPEVARATQWFREENRNVLSDRRVQLRIDDGRRILARSRQPINLLTSEPSNLWMSGVSLLFTREFFGLAAEALGDRGVFCQWLHLYQIGEEDVRTFLATVSKAFPHLVVFSDESDLFVVASRHQLNLDPEVWARRMKANEAAGTALAGVGIRSAANLAAGILADERAVRSWTRGAVLHTDDHPVLEFSAARNMSFDRSRLILAHLVAEAEKAGPIRLGSTGTIGQ